MTKYRYERNISRLVLLLAGVTLLMTATACITEKNTEQDVIDIRKVLEKRDQAIESKDIELYRSLFDPEYNDGRFTLNEIIGDMKQLFDNSSGIEFTYQKAPVEFNLNSARVISRLVYTVEGRKPIHNHEQLLLRKINGKWYISGGVMVGLF